MRVLVALLVLLSVFTQPANSADFPTKPIKVIVTFAAGSVSDIIIRILVDQVRAKTGAALIVENVPGANGILGIERARREPADGYTLVQTGTSTHSLGSAIFKSVTYDPIKDFEHIVLVSTNPNLLVVKTGRYASLASLIEVAKKAPGTITFGYASASTQVGAASFQKEAGVDFRPVPYKAANDALIDVISDRIDFSVVDPTTSASLIESGQIKPLAAFAQARSQSLKDVPTAAELGFSKLNAVPWYGLATLAGVDSAPREWLVQKFTEAISDPKTIELMRAKGSEPLPGTDINKWVREQMKAWQDGAAIAGLTPQ